MREADLTRDLAAARDALTSADQLAGRDAVGHRVQKHQRQRLAAVLVAAVVLVGGAAIGLSKTGSDEQGLVTTPEPVEESLPRLVPTVLPAGWTLSSVIETPLSDEQLAARSGGTPVNPSTIHGVWTDGPVAEPDPGSRIVVVLSQELDAVQAAEGFDGPPVTSTRVEPFGNTRISTAGALVGDRWVSVVGRNFTEEEASAVLDQVSVAPDGSLDVPPPAGVTAVPTEGTVLAGSFDWTMDDGAAYSLGADGYVERFAEPSTGPRGSVVVQRLDQSFLWMQLVFPSGPVELTSFDGHPAMYATHTSESCSGSGTGSPDGTTTNATDRCDTTIDAESVIWWPSPGVMVAVQALTRDQVLQIANSLTEVDDTGWSAFVGPATGDDGTAPAAPMGEPNTQPSMETTTSLRDDTFGGVPATIAPPAGSPTPTSTTLDGQGGSGMVAVPPD